MRAGEFAVQIQRSRVEDDRGRLAFRNTRLGLAVLSLQQ